MCTIEKIILIDFKTIRKGLENAKCSDIYVNVIKIKILIKFVPQISIFYSRKSGSISIIFPQYNVLRYRLIVIQYYAKLEPTLIRQSPEMSGFFLNAHLVKPTITIPSSICGPLTLWDALYVWNTTKTNYHMVQCFKSCLRREVVHIMYPNE